MYTVDIDVDLLFMSAYLGELFRASELFAFVIRAIWLFPIPWRDCWVPRVLIGLKNSRYTCSFPICFLSFSLPSFVAWELWAGTWDLGLGTWDLGFCFQGSVGIVRPHGFDRGWIIYITFWRGSNGKLGVGIICQLTGILRGT